MRAIWAHSPTSHQFRQNKLPSSPIAMMPFSSPTLQGKTRMASTYLQQHPEELGGSSLQITRSGAWRAQPC